MSRKRIGMAILCAAIAVLLALGTYTVGGLTGPESPTRVVLRSEGMAAAQPVVAAILAALAGVAALVASLSWKLRHRRAHVLALVVVLLAGATFRVGMWRLMLTHDGLFATSPWTLASSRDRLAEVSAIALEQADPARGSSSLRLTFAGGEELVVDDAEHPGSCRLLDDALQRTGRTPTLALAPGSPAAAAVEARLARTREEPLAPAPYLELLDIGRCAAVVVMAEATRAGQSMERSEAARKPLLDATATALLALPGLFATSEARIALAAELEARNRDEQLVWDAVISARSHGELAGLQRLVELLSSTVHRTRFLAAQNLLVLIDQGIVPPEASPAVPGATESGAWSRLQAVWRDWLETNRDRLRHEGGYWTVPSATRGIAALGDCARTRIPCLEQLVDLLDATDTETRKLVAFHLERLVCPDSRPRMSAPEFPLDESWGEFARQWHEWMAAHREGLSPATHEGVQCWTTRD